MTSDTMKMVLTSALVGIVVGSAIGITNHASISHDVT